MTVNEQTEHTDPRDGETEEVPAALEPTPEGEPQAPEEALPAADEEPWPAIQPFPSAFVAPEKPADAAAAGPPSLDRVRPQRDRLVPAWVVPVLAVIAALVVVGVAGFFGLRATNTVEVPDVTGVSLGVARTRLAQAGFEAQVTERRFSTQPAEEVLEQSPAGGATAEKGSAVTLVVSAGSEDMTMPDVIGDGLTLARGVLEGKGLVVVVQTQESDLASDTVLLSVPSAGAPVRTGDEVRLTVASPKAGGGSLKPYRLQGITVLIDPAPTPEAAPGVTDEVARRLRALLEASGATVVMSRSEAETDAPVADRTKAAKDSSATVSVGLYVDATGAAGRIVSTPVSGNPALVASAGKLASAITSELAAAAPPVARANAQPDPVLSASGAPWAKVRLGSAASRQDESAFADPGWFDRVARALYAALGKTYDLGSAQ